MTTTKNGFMMMTPGERVRWLLVVRQLTQSDAARLAGISQSTISNIVRLRDRQPNSQSLLALSRVLECDPRFIVEGTHAPKISTPKVHHPKDVSTLELITLFEQLTEQKRLQLLVMAKVLAGISPLEDLNHTLKTSSIP